MIVRLGAMGDVIHTLAAVSSLRATFPSMQIGWIIEDRWSELLCAGGAPLSGPRSPQRPLVDVVHVVHTKRWRRSLLSRQTKREIRQAVGEVRNQHYEIAADFQGALKSAVVTRMSQANAIFGFVHPREWPARIFYQHQVETSGAHVIEQYHSLAEAVAENPLPHSPTLFPRDERAEASIENKISGFNENFAIINPGAGWGAKQWPAAHYGEVARALSLSGLFPLINFGPNEHQLAYEVQTASGGSAQPISCSISELIVLTRRARLFIGGDTGPLHLAAALKVPVVAIFGPTNPARNGPYGTKSIVLRNSASKTSLSHTRAPDPGLLAISASEVVSAAHDLLRSTSV
ncbi:MAG: glycosyltransferase family 9 protein [Terriglobales bacterium]